MRVCFEESTMQVLSRGGMQKRSIITPIFRLPDGTEFTGRRASPVLRTRITKAGRRSVR